MVNILSGLLWFSPKVAETLVKLHCLTPLDGCTYMGADSGEISLKISLYYDILTACCTQVSLADFLIGNCGKTLLRGRHSSPAMVAARKHVWAEMREFRIVENVLKGLEHKYLPPWESLDESELIIQWKFIHPYAFGHTSLVFRLGDSIILDSSIKDTSCKLVIGYTANLKEESSVMLNICKDPVNIIYYVSGTLVSVIFSLTDKFFEPCNGHGGQLFGIPWNDALNQLNLTPEQVWNNISDNFRTMYTAKLYRVNGELRSLEFITSNHDIGVSLATRSSLHQEMVCRSLEETGELINPTKYTDIFNLAVKDGWSTVLLQVLDKMALADSATKDLAERTSRLAFILAMTADLLGCMAKGEGGLRSGPANNKDFSHGFSLMEKGEYVDGLIALTKARSLWLDRPVRMVRAARHYEGVVQLLIRRTVMSAESQIMVDLSTAEARPDMEKEIKIQCPARLDLSGGWTDTPPICYELGGKVVDLAITLNGKKPIGCLVRRIPELHVEIVLDEGEVVFIRSHSDLENHCNPTAKGALVKCCLISAKLLSLESNDSVQVQLKNILGSGLRLKLWSELPQGSGLGTSSILAGAVVAGCWTAVGCRFSTRDVVHAVLVVEQLLTTGGGWQDQVGGLHPGFNLGTTPQDHNVSVSIQPFKPSPGFITALEKRLLVLYTGKPRLAKNLLQNVIRNWYSREPTIYQCFQENYRLAGTCWEAVTQENINCLGDCLTEYWRIKRTLAPGAEPELVKNIFTVLEPYSVGGTLAGAGGGGFLTAILKVSFVYSTHLKYLLRQSYTLKKSFKALIFIFKYVAYSPTCSFLKLFIF